MNDMDINTRIEITNETVKEINRNGQAGNIGLIGAFPTIDKTVYVFDSIEELYDQYGIVKYSNSYKNFNGSRAASRLFLDGIDSAQGASTVTTVNVTDGTLQSDDISITVDSGQGLNITQQTDIAATHITYESLFKSLTMLQDEDIDGFFIASPLDQAIPLANTKLYNGVTISSDGNINHVYDLVNYFQNKVYSTQKPCWWVHWLNCPLSNQSQNTQSLGIKSSIIDATEAVKQAKYINEHDTTNLSTAGIYYQSAYIQGEATNAMETAAHMCGVTASLPVGTSLTGKRIPGITGINEEAYFGAYDDGFKMMNAGINILKPYQRRDGTFTVKNSIQPSGFDAAHVTAVSYLLKQYDFLTTIGEINYDIPISVLKAQLESINQQVMQAVPVISDVIVGTEKILSPWKIYIPIKIKLRGIIDVIKIGVSMELTDDTNGTVVTVVDTTSATATTTSASP